MDDTRVSQPSDGISADPVPFAFLVPLDGSSVAERALPVARVVSTGFGASLRAANVPAVPDDPTKDEIGDFLADVATGTQASVICLSWRAHTEHNPCGLPDLADRVLQRLNGPALIVGPHCSSGSFDVGGPVVVCHDGTAASSAILAPASTWATALDVPIYLIHVTDPRDVTSDRDPRANIAGALDQLGPSARVEVVRSSLPAGAIRDLAHEIDASIVAMSTHGKTSLERTSLGSVTAWVVREAFCPVLVTRPAGIVT